MDRKNAWTTYSKEELDRLEQVNTEYKNCLMPARQSASVLHWQLKRQKQRDIRISEISLKTVER